MKAKVDKTVQPEPKKLKRPKLPGQQHFSGMKEYLSHVEDNLGRLHLETSAKVRGK